jgi:hypothetical protein
MPIPSNTGLQDISTGVIYPRNLGTWADLASTIEITVSNVANSSNNYSNTIVSNVTLGNLKVYATLTTANSNVIILGTRLSNANIANISVGQRIFHPNIAANTTITSIRNSNSGSTWDNYHSWLNNPAPYFIWTSPIIDNSSSIIFNCLINTVASGNVTYEIRSTDAGFDGTETLRTVAPGATDIAAHQGRFLSVAANVVSTGGLASLTTMDVNVINERLIIPLSQVNTSNLAGTSSARQLDLGRNVSYINNLQMTPYSYSGGSGYTVAGYVTSGYFDEVTITGAFPQIIDKANGGANIAVVDNAGNYIDSTLDILVYALPEQYRNGNNISQR